MRLSRQLSVIIGLAYGKQLFAIGFYCPKFLPVYQLLLSVKVNTIKLC